jgi:hypothetical protein
MVGIAAFLFSLIALAYYGEKFKSPRTQEVWIKQCIDRTVDSLGIDNAYKACKESQQPQ